MSAPLHLTTADMSKENLAKHGTILVEFWAPWCGPCRMVAPVLDALAAEYEGKIAIGKLNIDENSDPAIAMGVSSIPTMIVFKDGVEVERVIGAQPKPMLKALLDRNL